MLIPIPRSVGQMTGWKAVVGVIVFVGLVGGSMWLKFQPHEVTSGTFQIDVAHWKGLKFKVVKSIVLSVEVVPESAGEYWVMLLDDANGAKLATADPDTLTRLGEQKGTGPITLGKLHLNAGQYHMAVVNLSSSTMSARYKLVDMGGE